MQASDEVAGVVTSTSVQLFATMSVTEGAIASPEPLNVERAFSHPLSHVPFRMQTRLASHHELLPCVGKPRPACLALSPCAVSDRASGTHSR
jgi:hypothetical protein